MVRCGKKGRPDPPRHRIREKIFTGDDGRQGKRDNHSQCNLKGGLALKLSDIIFIAIVVLIMVGMVVLSSRYSAKK